MKTQYKHPAMFRFLDDEKDMRSGVDFNGTSNSSTKISCNVSVHTDNKRQISQENILGIL